MRPSLSYLTKMLGVYAMNKSKLLPGHYVVRILNGSPSAPDKLEVLSRPLSGHEAQQELQFHREQNRKHVCFVIGVDVDAPINAGGADLTDTNRTHESRVNSNFVDYPFK